MTLKMRFHCDGEQSSGLRNQIPWFWHNTVHLIPALRADTDETDNGTNSDDEAEKIDPLTGSIIPAERNLSRDLFNHGYDKTVRPAKTAKDIVNITMDLLLLRVVAMVSGDICVGN